MFTFKFPLFYYLNTLGWVYARAGYAEKKFAFGVKMSAVVIHGGTGYWHIGNSVGWKVIVLSWFSKGKQHTKLLESGEKQDDLTSSELQVMKDLRTIWATHIKNQILCFPTIPCSPSLYIIFLMNN